MAAKQRCPASGGSTAAAARSEIGVCVWSDSETSTDFLGFELLIDTIHILVSDESLRPVTIGIDGTWGSGKTSLMEMVSDTVEESEDKSLKSITFSPWVYEDYDDIKYALIDAILDVVVEQSSDEETAQKATRARAIARRLVAYRGAITKIVSLSAGAGAAAVGLPEGAVPAAAIAADVTDGALDHLAEMPADDDAIGTEPEATTVAGLRELLKGLLSGLPNDLQLVVFVDDVDRCLPDTVVRTFEVMRLFSDIPEVTFVLAADRGIVEEAISARYRSIGFTSEGRSIGRDYLEKMWNVTVKIPPLSAPEVEAYLTLLSCQRHHPDAVAELTEKARERRRAFGSLRLADIDAAIGDPSAEFYSDWTWITATADIIATMHETHPGNPRQIKRFANRLSLGIQLLKKNGVKEVDAGVLVKLMLLEERDAPGFTMLMQNAIAAGDGEPEFLQRWERPYDATEEEEDEPEDDQGGEAREVEDAQDTATDGALEKQSSFFKEWLALEPRLAGVDLRPYLYVARDQSLLARDARNLSDVARSIMENLGARMDSPIQTKALEAFDTLDSGEQALIVGTLKRTVSRKPADKATNALLALAKANDRYAPAALEALQVLPPASVSGTLPIRVAEALAEQPSSVRPLLEKWAKDPYSTMTQRAATSKLK